MENLPVAIACGLQTTWAVERQLTFGRYGHVLTNAGVWSPDGDWIVYDTRTDSEKFTGTRIERVNVQDGTIDVVYESRDEAACGVASFSPVAPVVVFMHGPEHPSSRWSYGFTRRYGVICDLREPRLSRHLDAMNYTPPFSPGALRGGSHLHLFHPDGRWLSFTYEDEVLAQLGEAEGADGNQRNVAVAFERRVEVNQLHPRNHAGDYFSVVVSNTVRQARPGSDEIVRATDEAWIGLDGYMRKDANRQRRALVFQGHVTNGAGQTFVELFVADLPDALTVANGGAIEGTSLRRPAPPSGVKQRRLTHTGTRAFPGMQGPRHWPRSSPDGAKIACLMRDDVGVVQLWVVSPNDGTPVQLTRNKADVASAFSWSPDGRLLAHVLDGSVCVSDAQTGSTFRLTELISGAAAPLPLACVFSPNGKKIAYQRPVSTADGSFSQVFVVGVPNVDQLLSMQVLP